MLFSVFVRLYSGDYVNLNRTDKRHFEVKVTVIESALYRLQGSKDILASVFTQQTSSVLAVLPYEYD